AISHSRFGSCGDTLVSCVPTIGVHPRNASRAVGDRVLEALRRLLDECRARDSKLSIFIPDPPPIIRSNIPDDWDEKGAVPVFVLQIDSFPTPIPDASIKRSIRNGSAD